MKKFLSCILVLALFLSLGLFGSWNGRALADTPEDRVGTYVLTGLIMDGEDYTEILESANIVFTLELRADGTGLLIQGEDELELTWDESAIYGDDGIPEPYTYDDGVLVIEEATMIMTFEKTDKVPAKTADGEDKGIVDTWVGTLDIKPFIEEAEPDLGALLENAPLSIIMEMREDGTYTMQLDASPIITPLRAAMFSYLQKLCDENGITIEQLEESYGKSMDEVVDEALEGFDLTEINQTVEGVYEESNGQVIWDKGANETRGLYTGDTVVFSLPDFGEVVLTRAGIYGIWVSDVDLMSFIGEGDEELGALLEGINVQINLELRSDDTFTLAVDAEALIPALRVVMLGYFEQYLAESGITAEELEQMTGQTLDQMVDELLGEMDMDEYASAISGTYEVKDDQIFLKADNTNTETGTLQGGKIIFSTEEYGDLCFLHVINEDVLAKSEGVMTYAEYEAAEEDDPVVIEAYVLDHQSWWNDSITVYAQDADGAYFIYNMACSEDDAAKLVPGAKIRVSGYKSVWAGEVEIVDASFEFVRGSYQFRAADLTDLLGRDELEKHQNQLVTFKGLTIEPYDESGAAFAYKDADGKTDDLYFKASKDGVTYDFCVEFYLRGSDTDVYKAVEGLKVGDVVNLKGYLYWYEGPNPHIIGVTVKEHAAD